MIALNKNSMKNRFGLYDSDIDEIIAVLARNPKVEKACFFGSRAKGTFRNGLAYNYLGHQYRLSGGPR